MLDPTQWHNAVEEDVYGLSRSSVVYADYAAILHDFPWLAQSLDIAEPSSFVADAKPGSSRKIDDWLIANAAVVSIPQLRQTRVNDTIPVLPNCMSAMRPAGYGRAVVVPIAGAPSEAPTEQRWLDTKGVGVGFGREPAIGAHCDGLADLDLLLSELIVQRIVERVLRHNGAYFAALPCYALIDCGFAKDAWWTGTRLRRPAGLLVRRVHRRRADSQDLPLRFSPGEYLQLTAEFTLRRYGLTTCNASSSLEFRVGEDGNVAAFRDEKRDTRFNSHEIKQLWRNIGAAGTVGFAGINVQLTVNAETGQENAELVDFGHISARVPANQVLASLVSNRPFNLGAVCNPEETYFPRADTALRLPLRFGQLTKLDGAEQEAAALPLNTMVGPIMRRSVAVLSRFGTHGQAARDAVARCVADLVDEATGHLSSIPAMQTQFP